jgi:hypothetical protein
LVDLSVCFTGGPAGRSYVIQSVKRQFTSIKEKVMQKLSPELEALMTTVIYLDCRLQAVLGLLADKGIVITNEVIDSEAHKIHAAEGDLKRYEIFCRIKDGNFDIKG